MVWVAEGVDLLGLVTEAESLDALWAKLQVLVPELVALNAPEGVDSPIEVRLEVRQALSNASDGGLRAGA